MALDVWCDGPEGRGLNCQLLTIWISCTAIIRDPSTGTVLGALIVQHVAFLLKIVARLMLVHCCKSKCTIKLSEAERHTLQQTSVNHRHRDIRRVRRDSCCWATDLSAPKAGCERAVDHNWSRLWEQQGPCGLLSGHGRGRPRALSDAMLATAMEVTRTESMTLGQIAKRIEAVHGKPMPHQMSNQFRLNT
jgi:hypothetical protein